MFQRGDLKAEKRYPLLLYREWMRLFVLPAFFIAIFLFGLWAVAHFGLLPVNKGISRSAQDLLLGIAALVAIGLWLIVSLLPRAAFVQCLPDYLLLRLGFLRLIVSYSRLRGSGRCSTTRSSARRANHAPAARCRCAWPSSNAWHWT